VKKNLFKIAGISIIAFLCGILGAYGGADGTIKNWRRIVIPVIITIVAYLTLHNSLVLILLGIYIAFAMGYGIPDGPPPLDQGSIVGRFWYNLFNHNHLLADIFTRGTVGLLVSLFLICIPIIKNNWFVYIISSVGVTVTYSLISWRDLGVYRLLGKQLLWSETLTYLFTTLFILVTIYF